MEVSEQDLETNGLVDAHCHVDLYPDPKGLLQSIDKAGIHVVTVTNIPSVFPANAQLAKGFDRVHVALGLHPELVKSHDHELPRFQRLLPSARFVGEVGLDYTTRDEEERSRQRAVFSSVLEWCADSGSKVLTIHSRRATSDVISMVGHGYPCSAILHWFSGTTRQLEQAADAGLYFSVNAAMIRSKTGQSLIARMPPENVLTESDGPFVRTGRRPAEPAGIAQVVRYLGEHWGYSYELAKDHVLANFERAMGMRRQ